MKILLIHNTYQHKGGEDSVLQSEYQLLQQYNNEVEKLIFDNSVIKTPLDKLNIGLSTLYSRRSSQILTKKIDEFNPDIIHVHNFFPIASPSIFYVASSLNVPIVMTLHNYRLICPNALLFRDNKVCEKCIDKSFALDGVLNGCYRDSKVQTFILALMSYVHKKKGTWSTKIDRYIALTNFAKNKMLNSSLFLDKSQIVVKPNFIEDCGYAYEKDDYFVFVGRLSTEKGIELLLNTFEKIDKKLLIIGNGPLEALVKEKSKENKNIDYLGYQNKDYILKTVKKAKALIFTSICYETFGLVIIEALSVATPVIVPNIGGPNEMITDGVNGVIYEVNSVNDLLNKVLALCKNETLFKDMCINARKEYEANYTASKNYELLLKIYQEVIDEKV